jgi:hypothetical protein
MNVKKKIRIITETYLRISQLYGVTFEGDYPPEARTKPIVVRSIFGAVQQQQVYVVDANAYTNRSGPRLVCGLKGLHRCSTLKASPG